MENSALSCLRCLRTRAPLLSNSITRSSNMHSVKTCAVAAKNIRLYSITAINSPRSPPRSRALYPSSAPLSRLRFYSSDSPSTIKGTVGAGAEGVAQEEARAADILQAPDHLDEAEKNIWDKLSRELQPTKLQVQDISGGCGSMYGIEVVSEKFRGLNMLKQQRLVNKVLGEEIKGWHGVQLRTSVP
ncbi:hypothetical protein OCU04_009931 [Sclerotinia nivalis]|uniref:Bola-like protein n=1 Tax=Sclerotinia nivalis TaxID=352851 RepID=A0A9X0AER7_9HELO|nr:hypothetical protein OCU04_009931 [Sclerotinia nivalis]